VDHLAGGVDTGICAACDDNGGVDRGTGGLLGQRALNKALDGPQARLTGPAIEVRAVVADVQTQTNEPALPGGDSGLVRIDKSRQDSSSSTCDGGKL
jgi:hypothetical protein